LGCYAGIKQSSPVLPQLLVQKSFINLQNSFFPQNFPATQTVEKIKKIQAI
jgi:hypothetical protein